MAEIRQDLKLESDPSTIVRPNIVGDNIPDGDITTDKLADSSVTTAKINDGAVTTDKLEDASVTNDKIAGGSVTSDKLGADSVNGSHIANGAITNAKLATGTIENSKVKNNTLTREKMASINGTLLTDYVVNEGPKEEIQQFVDMMGQFIEYGYKLYYESSDEIANVSLYVDVMQREVKITIDANVYNLPASTLLTGHVVTLTSDADVALFFSSLLSNYFAVSAIYSNHVFN